MPLSNQNITTLANTIIADYQLSSIPNIQNHAGIAVQIADLKLEKKYPDIYNPTLDGTTVEEIQFLQLRETYAAYILFTSRPQVYKLYSQANSVNEVRNSAGSSVVFKTSNLITVGQLALILSNLLSALGLETKKSSIVFESQINQLT